MNEGMRHFGKWIWVVLIIWACEVNDNNSPDPEDLYVKYYGTGSNEAVDLVALSSGENIVLATNTLNEGDADIFLIKTDEAGNEITSVIYDVMDGSEDVPKRLKALGDGTFLLVGYIIREDASGVDQYAGAWCIIDSELNITSSGSDSSDFKLITDVLATDIIQTTETDGVDKYVVLGYSTLTFAGDEVTDGNYQVYLGKYDLSDSVYWEKSHGYEGNDYGVALFEEDDGGLMFVGSTESEYQGYTGRNIFVERTSSLGTSDKSGLRVGVEEAASDADEVPYRVIPSSLGYSIVGSTQNSSGSMAGFHVAINLGTETMSVLTSDILEMESGNPCEIYAATITNTNDLLVTGTIPNYTDTEDGTSTNWQDQVLIMKANLISGHLSGYDENYGTSVGDDYGAAVLTLSDGDVLVAATIDFGSGTSMVGLMRLNKNGELKD